MAKLEMKEIKTIFLCAFFTCLILLGAAAYAQRREIITISTLKSREPAGAGGMWIDVNFGLAVNEPVLFNLGYIPQNFRLLWRIRDRDGNVLRYGIADKNEFRTGAASTASVYLGAVTAFPIEPERMGQALIYSRAGCCGNYSGRISARQAEPVGQVLLVIYRNE